MLGKVSPGAKREFGGEQGDPKSNSWTHRPEKINTLPVAALTPGSGHLVSLVLKLFDFSGCFDSPEAGHLSVALGSLTPASRGP